MSEETIENNIKLVTDSNIDIYDLSSKNELVIRDIIEQNDYDIVVIDYLQTIKSSQKFKDERMKFNYLVDFINKTRRISDTSILLLSQVNRKVDERKPYLSDLKETAAIEEASDMVMFLFKRQDMSIGEKTEQEKKINLIEAIINKNRYGGLTEDDQIILTFNTDNMNFYCTEK